MTKNNEDIYRVMGKPLVRKVLEGFNAVLIAYGQTGSGKTHTLVGKPEQGVKGVLPFMLEELLNTESVKTLSVSGCEAYGTHVSRIELYDLFKDINNQPDWTKKKGQGGLEPKKCTAKPVTTQQQCWDAINEAHDASHFAPTGKNPESSRGTLSVYNAECCYSVYNMNVNTYISTGHVAFCTKVEQEKGGSIITSYLIVVDLAGSEGESAFTPEFVKKVDPPTLMARRLEAGCINTGLSQLQVVFNELKVKGKLTKSKGTGLRRILHAYINQNCMISVMFTLSPAFTNRTTTESTLKFAVQAGMVKVKPVKAKAQVNFKALVADLQKHVKEQEELIEKLNDDIEKLNDAKHDLEFKCSRLTEKLEYAQSSSGGGGDDKDGDGKKKGVAFSEEEEAKLKEVEDKRRALQKKGFKRHKSVMPDKLQSHLALFNDVQDEDEDEDGYQLSLDDQKSCIAINISAAKVDSDIQRIHNRRKTAAIDTNMLNAAIRRTTTLSNLKLGNLGALQDGDEDNKSNDNKPKVETPTPATYNIDDDDPDETPAFADIEERQHTIKQSMIGAVNIFDTAQNQDQGDDEEQEEDPDFMTFETKDTANMTKDELVDYCDQLESKLIEEKTLRYGLQKSQQVIIDHLMETNEALLQWFKIKKIL